MQYPMVARGEFSAYDGRCFLLKALLRVNSEVNLVRAPFKKNLG